MDFRKVVIQTSESHMCTMMNIEEIYAYNRFLDDSLRHEAFKDEAKFKKLLDLHLKMKCEETQKNSPCLCVSPKYRNAGTVLNYFEGHYEIVKTVCDECGYVFSEEKTKQ